MVATVEADFQFLKTESDLREYFHNLQDTIELRYPTITSLDWTESLIMIPFQLEERKSLLVPYDRLKAHTQEQKSPMNVNENVYSMAHRGMLQEVGFRVTGEINRLFRPYSKKDSKGDSKKEHIKHVAVITDFILKAREVISEKIGTPVWVHEDLLSIIFQKESIVEGEKKKHPHLRAYMRFKMWREGESASPNSSDGLDHFFNSFQK